MGTFELGFEHVSTDNALQASSQAVPDNARNTTWAIRIWANSGLAADNLVTVWATDAHGQALPLFARSTQLPPP
jgi:hypothetical protein